MPKVIDLSIFDNSTLDFVLSDGTTLHILKPTHKMAIEIMQFEGMEETATPQEHLKEIDKLCVKILNTNDAMRKFTLKEVQRDFNLPMKSTIIIEYSNYITGIQGNPI